MNGINDFEKQLADDIREIRKDVKETNKKVAEVDKKLAVHKAKSGLFGAAGGAGIVGFREIIDYIKASMGGG